MRWWVVGWMASALPAVAFAQQSVPDPEPEVPSGGSFDADVGADDGSGEPEIIVTAPPPPGQVIGDIKPELQLSPADIRAYGVSSISELLDELTPQTRSGRGREGGRPVVLLNGRRTSGFNEIRDLPTEAILRVDILPEEAALAYGYRADQRVVNFVLRPRFRSYTAELNGQVPTRGGSSTLEAEGGLLRIDQKGRFNLDLEYERDSSLLESERGLIATRDSRFDRTGNIAGLSDSGEIDPALSALAGQPVTIAAVPVSAATGAPTLGDFLSRANQPNGTDTTPFRTLRPASDRLSANAIYNRTLFGDVSATANLRLERTDNRALQGLPNANLILPQGNPYSPFAGDVALLRIAPGSALRRDSSSWTGEGSIALNGDVGDWQWSLNGNYDRQESETATERSVDLTGVQTAIVAGDPGFNPFGDLTALGPLDRLTDTARSVSSTGSVDGLVTGTPFSLPAGRANASLRLRGTTIDLDSRSVRGGIDQQTRIGRDSGNVRANLSLPIADRDSDVLAFLGDLSIDGNAEVERLSDFGTLTTLGYGLNWEPVDPLRLLVSVTREEGAPSPAELGNPVIVTPNVAVFDYVRGETVEITQVDGGNPLLIRDQRDVFKAGLTLKPVKGTDLTVSADYVSSRLRNDSTSFPAATAEIQAAFPDRFQRDADGRLIRVDNRPINFARTDRQELRWGFNFSKSITSSLEREIEARRARGEALPEGGFRGRRNRAESGNGDTPAPAPEGQPPANGAAQAAPPPERRGPGGGGRGGFGRGGDPGGRLQFSLYHIWHLQDRILIRDGLAPLDLLNGSATGSRGGQPRHELELRTGYSVNGLGVRLNGNYASGTRVDGGPTGGDRLDFGALATFDLRLFVDLGQQRSLARKSPFLRGSRVSLVLRNVFDAQQHVTDANGTVPLTYQPGLIDPLGRSIRISFRKLFF